MTDISSLVTYIQNQVVKGVGEAEIRKNLFEAGWQIADIEKAFEVQPVDPVPAPPPAATVSAILDGAVAQVATAVTTMAPVIGQAPVVETRLPGVFDLLGEAFGVYKDRFWALIGVTMVPFVLMLILGAIAGVALVLTGLWVAVKAFTVPGVNTDTMLSLTNTLAGHGIGLVIGGIVFIVVAVLLMVYFYAWSQLGLAAVVFNRGSKMGVRQAMGLMRGRVWSYLWLSFLISLIEFGGSVLLIVPGLIISVLISQTAYVFMVDGDRGMKAVIKAREYIRGYAWGVFGRMLAMGLILGVIVMIGSLAIGVVAAILKYVHLAWLGSVISTVYQWACQPLVIILPLVVFEHLRRLKPDINALVATKKSTKYTVLAVLGLLSFLVIPLLAAGILVAINPGKSMLQARDAKRRADLMQVEQAVEMYRVDRGGCPVSLDELVPSYMGKVATDSKSELSYEYIVSGNSCQVCAQIEATGKKECRPEEPDTIKRIDINNPVLIFN